MQTVCLPTSQDAECGYLLALQMFVMNTCHVICSGGWLAPSSPFVSLLLQRRVQLWWC